MSQQIDILITLPFTSEQLMRLQEVSTRLRITQVRARKTEDVPNEVWQRVEVLYTNRVLPTAEQAPNLSWIQFHWAGVDHALDTPILNKPGLLATTLSGAAATQVAEYVLMMLLSLGHRMITILNDQKRGEWAKDRWERFSPVELRDRTVGIVGYGSIGRQVARMLIPFGAKVLACKQNAMSPRDNGYYPDGFGDPEADYVHRLYPSTAIRSMVRECDFVVITVPLTSDTRNLINSEVLLAMKPSAFLVDVSRGGVVDHEALVEVLRTSRIAGAALDVYPDEPLPPDNILWKLSNVILTPHISGNTPYYDDRAIVLFSENLQRYLAKAPLLNLVNPLRGY